MADFLSRHPSPYNGAVIKSEQKFNDWFTINVVNEFANDSNDVIKARGKIATKMISGTISQSEARTRVFTDSQQNNSASQMPKINRSVKDNSTVNSNEMARTQELVKFIHKPIMMRTNSYKNFHYKTETLQKLRVFPLHERKNLILLARIHFSLLYLDQRLVIPKVMPENMFTALHFGHASRDVLLREAADVW